MTSYLGAALKGIGDGGGVLSQAMIQEQNRQDRWNEQLRNQRELELLRQQGREELLAMRQSGGGGGGAARGKGGGGVMDLGAGQGEELMAAQMGMSVPEYRQFVEMERTGSDKGYRTEVKTLDDEYGEMTSSALPEGFEEFKKQKRAQRAKLMETYTFSDDADKIAKARNTDVETGLLSKAGEGDRNAVEGILATKGKDPRETTARAGKADAEAKKATDQGELADRTDPNIRRTGGGGGGGRGSSDPELARLKAAQVSLDRSVMSVDSQEKAIRSAMKDMSRTQRQAAEADLASLATQRKELAAKKSSLLDQIVKLESGAPAKPTAPPKPGVNALPPGARQIGTSGGKPVYQTPDGKRFIQG